MPWAAEDTAGGGLCARRSPRRLVPLRARRSARPTERIPAACNGWAEPQAASRFLRHARVAAVDILNGQSHATLKRMERAPVVRIVQETTFGASGKEIARPGFGTVRRTVKDEDLLHPRVAFTPARVHVGGLGHHCWHRPEKPVGPLRKPRPSAATDSHRGLRGAALACQVQRRGVQTVGSTMADRAGAMHAWLLAATHRPAPERAAVSIRATGNRRVVGEPTESYV